MGPVHFVCGGVSVRCEHHADFLQVFELFSPVKKDFGCFFHFEKVRGCLKEIDEEIAFSGFWKRSYEALESN